MWDRDHMRDWNWGMGWLWLLIFFVIVAGTAAIAVWAITRTPGRSGPPPHSGPGVASHAPPHAPPQQAHAPGTHGSHLAPSASAAREVLDRRLASGEIDIDDYRARRDALERPSMHEPVATTHG